MTLIKSYMIYLIINEKIINFYIIVKLLGWEKTPKKPNRPKNKTETEPKNRLIEPSGSVFGFCFTQISISD